MIAVGLLYLALISGQATPKDYPHQTPNLGGPDTLMVHQTQDKEDDARRFVDEFARCAASLRRKDAVAALALNYDSQAQSQAVHSLLSLAQTCWGPMISAASMQLSAGVVAGGMSEYFVLHPKVIEQLRQRSPASFVWPARNAMESFGDCVVAQGDGAVLALVRSRVASADEATAVQALTPALGQCVAEGDTVELDVGTIRQVLAFGLYRHMAVPPAAVPAVASPGN
ncbi:hypothetical protein ACUXST_001507 [Sphingomonas sp. F9_3S_D5_B_2]